MAKYKIYLLRHGQTFFNRYNKMQGWSDSPLTPEGEEVAHIAGRALKDVDFSHVFSSDARRAVDTARIMIEEHNKDLDQQIDSAFREQFYGYFEGMNSPEAWYMVSYPHGAKTFQELIDKYDIAKTKDFMKEADPFHDAENNEEYWNRLNAGFERLDKIAKDGDNILLVSHGTTIKTLAMTFGDGTFEVKKGPKNSSLTILERENGESLVTSYNKVLK